jgi:hypothetical protein
MILSVCEEDKILSSVHVLDLFSSVTAVIRLATYVISGLEPQGNRRGLDAKTVSLIVT